MISFVIIEYHSIVDVKECVSSIKKCCLTIDFEILVSSNSTYSLEERAELVECLPGARWIFNSRNGGFASGMNAGIKHSSGSIVVTMNPDVRIKSSNLSGAVGYMQTNSRIGILGPRIIDDQNRVQDSGRPFLTPIQFLKRITRRVFSDEGVLLEKNFIYEKAQPVDWVIGAFMMIRRTALEEVGLLDESYFLYVEDMDWCLRFWKKGYEVIYYPELEVNYKGDRKSTTTILNKKTLINKYLYYHIMSYLRFLKKFGLRPHR